MGTQRIAVLVDGDNINAAHAGEILSRAGKLGRVDVARVYAGLNASCEWLKTPGFRLFHAGAGKNAADILLCIDAMELALTGELSTFVIATSDGDFSHLALRQREQFGVTAGARPRSAGATQARARRDPDGVPGAAGLREGGGFMEETLPAG